MLSVLHMKLTLSGDEVVWSLVTLCDGESEKDDGEKKKKKDGRELIITGAHDEVRLRDL